MLGLIIPGWHLVKQGFYSPQRPEGHEERKLRDLRVFVVIII